MNYGLQDTASGSFCFFNGRGDRIAKIMLAISFADSNFTQEKIESYECTPWGVLLTSASKNNLLYTAREFDFEAGLQFNRNRYYSPQLGRFISKDLIINRNLFFYGKSNPVHFREVLGLYGGFIPGLFEEVSPPIVYSLMTCMRNYMNCVNDCFEERDSCWEFAQDCIKDCPQDNYDNWKDCVKNCHDKAAQYCTKTGGYNSCVYSCIDELERCLWDTVNGSESCGWEAEYGCSPY